MENTKLKSDGTESSIAKVEVDSKASFIRQDMLKTATVQANLEKQIVQIIIKERTVTKWKNADDTDAQSIAETEIEIKQAEIPSDVYNVLMELV